jgi:hypothetical protein
VLFLTAREILCNVSANTSVRPAKFPRSEAAHSSDAFVSLVGRYRANVVRTEYVKNDTVELSFALVKRIASRAVPLERVQGFEVVSNAL